MDDDILHGLEQFEHVWRRVRAASDSPSPPAPPRPDDGEQLRQFIEAEAADAAFYSALARRCTGAGRAVLTRLCAQERCHLRQLQMEYFLLTGDSCTPPRACPVTGGVISALRMAYLDELEGTEQYLEAAARTASKPLQALYTQLAKEERQHAAALRGLIGRVLT